MTSPQLALSVRQPWAWAIIHAGKDIENRSWRWYGQNTHQARDLARARTRIAIHASAGIGKGEYEDAREEIADILVRIRPAVTLPAIPPRDEIERGGIVGSIEIIAVVDRSDSPWFFGPLGLVLANPEPLPFLACKGTLTPMFWRVPEAVAA